jgi:hypothetical protein
VCFSDSHRLSQRWVTQTDDRNTCVMNPPLCVCVGGLFLLCGGSLAHVLLLSTVTSIFSTAFYPVVFS